MHFLTLEEFEQEIKNLLQEATVAIQSIVWTNETKFDKIKEYSKRYGISTFMIRAIHDGQTVWDINDAIKIIKGHNHDSKENAA
jgi:hypothetical protein